MFDIMAIQKEDKMVLTTEQIAQLYGTTTKMISNNYNNNREKYIEGKHYMFLKGAELKTFLQSYKMGVQNQNKIRTLYLWTEKGALLHAKSINTDKAWEVYDYLVDYYFRQQSKTPEVTAQPTKPAQPLKPMTNMVVDIPVNQQAQKLLAELQEELKAVEVVARMLNRYMTQENYTKTVFVLERLCMSVGDKGFSFREIKPQLIEKFV